MTSFFINHLINLSVKLLVGLTFLGAIGLGYHPLLEVSAATNLAPQPTLTTHNLHYRLDQADPSYLSAVQFELTASANAVAVRIQFANDGPSFACTGQGTSWECPVYGVPVATLAQLRVQVSDPSADRAALDPEND